MPDGTGCTAIYNYIGFSFAKAKHPADPCYCWSKCIRYLFKSFGLYCNAGAWNMRRSLVYTYISQSILLQWNHVCFSSEIWLHATTKPTTRKINTHTHVHIAPTSTSTCTLIYLCIHKHEFCAVLSIYAHPSFSAALTVGFFSSMQMEMHMQAKNHHASSI